MGCHRPGIREQKKSQRVVAIQTIPQPAAFLLEIGQQPSLAMEIPDIFRRRLQSQVILSGAGRDALFHQQLDPFDQEFLFLR